MTQEEKSLLLQDLCARVPHHPKGHVVNTYTGTQRDEWLTCATVPMFTSIGNDCRLYLRSMSSMTDEEKKEYNLTKTLSIVDYPTLNSFDWLLAHHFVFRNLIEQGLAIEVTEKNNPYKD